MPRSGHSRLDSTTLRKVLPWRRDDATDSGEDESEVSSTMIEETPITIVVKTKVLSVVFSPDGEEILTGENNGRIRCWDVDDGEKLNSSSIGSAAVRCIAVSQDGKWAVAGTENGKVVVWDEEKDEKKGQFIYKKAVNSVDITSDGSKIAMATDDNNIVEVWSLADNTRVWRGDTFPVRTVKFSPDGLLFAVGADSEGSDTLSILDSQDGKLDYSAEICVRSFAWASDNQRLFVLARDGNIHSLDVTNKKMLTHWPIHSSNKPTCIALSKNDVFVAASANSSVSFWDTSTLQQIGTVIRHPQFVHSMAISRNYKLMIAGNLNIALWDLRNVLSIPYFDIEPSDPSEQGEDDPLETISSNTIERRVIETGAESKILSIALLADGEQLLGGDDKGKIRCWLVEDRKEVATLIDLGSPIRCLVTSRNGERIAAGTENGRVFVWDARTHREVNKFTYMKVVVSLDISSDGTKIAIVTDDTSAEVWSLPGGKRLWGRSECHTVSFSPNGLLFAVAPPPTANEYTYYFEDQQTSLFDIYSINQDGEGRGVTHTRSFSRPPPVPYHPQSPPSHHVASPPLPYYPPPPPSHHLESPSLSTPVQSFAWTSHSKRLFVLCSDNFIYRVDASSQKRISRWSVYSNDNPTHISLSSNGAFIAASANSSVSFWDTSTHEKIGLVIKSPHPVSCTLISPNYDLLTVGGSTFSFYDLRQVLSTPYIGGQERTTGAALKDPISELHSQLADAQLIIKQKEDALNSLRADFEVQNAKSVDLEKTVEELQQKYGEEIKNLETTLQKLSDSQQKSNAEIANLQLVVRAHRQKHECEILYADGRVVDAAKTLLDIARSINEEVKADVIITNWLSTFTDKCVSDLEHIGDDASRTGRDEEALVAYATALSLRPSSPNTFLHRWVSTMLLHGSINEVLDGAHELRLPRLVVHRAICDVLEGDGRVTDAVGCFQWMQKELAQATNVGNEQAQWELDFQRRCTKKLEKLAETALSSQDYNLANKHYSMILSLDPINRADILYQRSKARVTMRLFKGALTDADELIKLDPSCHLGYERRHAALLGLERKQEAGAAYNTMLLKLKESPDTRVRELRTRHAEVITTIRRVVRATISSMPRVLIDTTTGRLNDRTRQEKAFETLPIFDELVSSMTSEMDYARIWKEVKEFYRYVMFSHKWEHGEPLFQEVGRVTVYKLKASRGNIKLQTFCSLVRSRGFRWAWSDTCCIDKENNVVLQESLVAMFAWYRGSSLTIIHLCDISSEDEEPDGVRRSIWNTRVWTYQEYVAAQKVMFYTKDWKPYLGLTLENHKDSPIIRKEMEMSQASSEQVAVLQPGLDRVREKLYLASTRETTLVEDIAYSLLGILNASIPVIYGEGTRAVGRLLEYVLTGSGDATILAWTGTANDYNSCLPMDLSVYETVIPPHIPQMETAELDRRVTKLRASLPDLSLAVTLYDELNKLAPPTVASSRLHLPGIISEMTDITSSGQTYHAKTDLFGNIAIETTSPLIAMNGLCIVHPWIRPLLDQEFARGGTRQDKTTQALRLLARLQQPFGALLFEQVSRTEYKRVAADSLIMVRFGREVSLTDLISNIHTIEAL